MAPAMAAGAAPVYAPPGTQPGQPGVPPQGSPAAMRIDLITIFPEACQGYLDASIVGRARRRGLIEINLVDPRAWAGGRHRKVDDRPFGGGPGMVLMAPPLAGCLDYLRTQS